jgi:hypothetical protein
LKFQLTTVVMSSMFRSLVRWFFLIALLALAETAAAHSGYESETDVRIYADRMELNVRTTLGFAWKILGDRAPTDAGEAGQQTAVPLLKEKAPELFEVDSGGKQMDPKSVDCLFEVDDHVFLRLVYEFPSAWPLVMKARYFDLFDPLTFGTVRVFDQTDDPFNREIEALVEERIHKTRPVFTYDPNPPAEVTEVVSPVTIPENPKQRGVFGYAVAALLIALIWAAWRLFIKRSPP